MIICTRGIGILKLINLGEGVKELSRWVRQSKSKDLRSCRAGHKMKFSFNRIYAKIAGPEVVRGLQSSISPNLNM